MRHLMLAVAVGLVGCTPPPPTQLPTSNKSDAPGPSQPAPPSQPTPPTQPAPPTPQSTPAPQKSGCNGVTAQGTCLINNGHQIAQTCNTTADTLLPPLDCTATGQVCGFDSTGTAVCKALGTGGGAKGAPTTGSTTTNTMTSTTTGCGTLTFDGQCNGNTVHYCLNGAVTDLDCGSDGSCKSDGSCGGEGAVCCPKPTTTTTTGGGACGTLTYDGVCNGNTIHYCNGGMVQDLDCGSGAMCQSDTCGEGALCCPTSSSTSGTSGGGAGNCGSVTYAGTCIDQSTLQFCDGGTLTVSTCDNGMTCQQDSSGANCVSAGAGNCGSVTYAGDCIDSTTLEFCDGGTLSVSDCSPGSCQVGADGANCVY